jgi:hypothetical protein
MRIGIAACIIAIVSMAAATPSQAPVYFGARFEPAASRVIGGWGQFSYDWSLREEVGKRDADDLDAYAAFFDFIRSNPAIKAFSIHPTMRLTRWIKAGADVRQQLADPRFIDASQAPSLFRPSRSEQ